MKKVSALILLVFACGCGTVREIANRPLYEILIEKNDGGAKVRFFEILSEPEEFVMIASDPELKGKVESDAIKTANFLILSAGEKPTGGYSIGIESVIEEADQIIVKVKETAPEPGAMVTTAFTAPYSVVRINSKKKLVID
jgi:hypothetical protein